MPKKKPATSTRSKPDKGYYYTSTEHGFYTSEAKAIEEAKKYLEDLASVGEGIFPEVYIWKKTKVLTVKPLKPSKPQIIIEKV